MMVQKLIRTLSLLSYLISGVGYAQLSAKKSAPGVEHLMAHSQWPKAEAELRRLLAQKPEDVHLLSSLAVVSEKQSHWLEAERSLRRAIRINSDSAVLLSQLGKLYQEEDRFPEAVPIYEHLVEISAGLQGKLDLATSYQGSGQYEKSLALIQAIPDASRPKRLMPVEVGDYLGLNRPEEAQAEVGRILPWIDRDPNLLPQLAKMFLRRNMVGDVFELFRVAGPHQQRTALFLGVLALVESRSGHKAEAQAAAEQALALDPKCTDALIVSSQLAGQAGAWNAAQGFLRRAVRASPPTAETLQSLVYASMQLDDLQSAHDAALDLHEMRPDLPEGALALAAVLIRASHWGEARPVLETVLSKNPDDKRAHLAEGIALYHVGELDSATQHLKASLGQGAADAEAHRTLGLIAKEHGDISSAAAETESALAMDSHDSETIVSLGQLYLQMDKPDKARELLEKAVALKPQDSQAHYQLALAYRRLGMTEKVTEQMKLFESLTARQVPDSPPEPVNSHR